MPAHACEGKGLHIYVFVHAWSSVCVCVLGGCFTHWLMHKVLEIVCVYVCVYYLDILLK